jgi:CheY-like chemotaxis protein
MGAAEARPAAARVLVIDDEVWVRDVARASLEEEGYHVREAAGGAEGLRALRAGPADAVVCDLFMPGMDGLEVLRALRRDFPAVPVVVMSGAAFEGTLDLLRAAGLLGAARILNKPFRPAELAAAVGEALRGARGPA